MFLVNDVLVDPNDVSVIEEHRNPVLRSTLINTEVGNLLVNNIKITHIVIEILVREIMGISFFPQSLHIALTYRCYSV